MANNLLVKTGDGGTATTRTDDVSGVHYPYVKLAHGDEDSSTPVTSTDPMPVEGLFELTGEDHIGSVGSNPPTIIRPSITVSLSAYTAGDVVGGEITLTDAMRVTSGSGYLDSVIIHDTDNEKAAFTLLFFDADPAANVADNAAFSWGTGDPAKLLAKVTVATVDYETLATDAVWYRGDMRIPVKANGSKNLYLYIVTTGTPTFTATTDLRMAFGFAQA